MKANAIFFALAAAATTASTVSAMNEGEKLVARDANCDFCFERFDFCIKDRPVASRPVLSMFAMCTAPKAMR
ncbi:unnamed protein product [Alternaria sp. RS040]